MFVRPTNLTTSVHFKLQDIFVAMEAMLTADDVKVNNMQGMVNIFDFAGANTMATLSNIRINDNNAFTATTPAARWTGVNVRGGAKAIVSDVMVQDSTNVRYVFAAEGEDSMLMITNFDADNLDGGRGVVSEEI
jgi:hypothetical protein